MRDVPWDLASKVGICTGVMLMILGGHAAAQPVADRQIVFRIGDSEVTLRERVRIGPASQMTFFAPHDDESIGVTAAEAIIEKHGGRLLELKSPHTGSTEYRYLTFTFKGRPATVDPNRIFSETGVLKTLKAQAGNHADLKKPGPFRDAAAAEVLRFGKALLTEIKVAEIPLLIALHNNWNGKSIWMRQYYADRDGDPNLVHWNKKLDEDDFMLLTSDGLFNVLKPLGYNLVLEPPNSAPDDGSLSVYCSGQAKPISYVNVEAERKGGSNPGTDHLAQQSQMLEALVIYHINSAKPPAERVAIPRPVP